MNHEELLTLEEAAKRYGVTRITLRRRIIAGDLVIYRDGHDLRRRLIAQHDLDQLFRPQRIETREAA